MSPTHSIWPGSGWGATYSRDWLSRWPWHARPIRRRYSVATWPRPVCWGWDSMPHRYETRDSRRSFTFRSVPWSSSGWVFECSMGGTLQFIEESVRVALHYPGQLPREFRAILILVPNAALGLLSMAFKRYWNDRELGRHCHYLGISLSIAAGTWSCSEPLAGLICLSGYAILYLVAVWLFAAPWVTYLGIAALTGAIYLGSTLVPAIHLADQALLAAILALAFWAIRHLLQWSGADQRYRTPWLHAALLLTATAFITATDHLAFVSANSWTAALTFLLVAVLAVLWNRDWSRTTWAWLTVGSLVEFTICGLALATSGKTVPAHDFGLLFVSERAGRFGGRRGLRSPGSRTRSAAHLRIRIRRHSTPIGLSIS